MVQNLKLDNSAIVRFLEDTRGKTHFLFRNIEETLKLLHLESAWGEFNFDGELISLLFKSTYGHYIFYAIEDFDIESYALIMKDDNSIKLFGIKTSIEKFEGKLKFKNKIDDYFCKLDNNVFKSLNLPSNNLTHTLALSDKEAIKELYAKAEDLNISDEVINYMYAENQGYGFGIKVHNKLVSLAQGVNDFKSYAIISGVCTDPEFERKGYATLCTSKLCEKYINDNKEIFLFYNNPLAGNIYKNLGFQQCGIWRRYTD